MHEQVVLRRLHNLTFEQLRTFVATARAGSVTRAAEALLLTQSAVSQRLRQMEDILGTPVFTRAPGQPVRLRFAGELVLSYADRILELLDELQDRLDEEAEHRQHATLTLAIASSASRHLLPTLLEQLAIRDLAIQVKAREGDAQGISAMVEEGVADLGIQMDMRHSPHIRRVPFKMDRFGLCLPPGVSFDGSLDAFEPLSKRPFALQAQGIFRQIVDQWAKAVGLRLSPALETMNLESMAEFVAHGLGLAFLPEFVVRERVIAGMLAFAPVQGLPSDLPMFVVYDGRRDPPAAAQAVLDVVMDSSWRHGDWSLDPFVQAG